MERGEEIVKQTVVFLLMPGLSMMSLTSAIEPLRSLNRHVGADAYEWRLASLDGAPVAASNGIPLPTLMLDQALEGASALFICGGLRIQEPDERNYLPALRRVARSRIVLGSLSTGSFLLARAGLLDGYRCTIHWENLPAFQEAFPDLDCSAAIFEIDRERMTCSGGTAALDMMLKLISDRFGAEHARFVANQFHHERIRPAGDEQRGGSQEALALLPPKLRHAVSLMQRQIEAPVTLPAIAKRVGVSPRQLERLFLRYSGMTPLRYYMQVRIERGRELLLYSDWPIIEVAIAAGFTSTSHFASWYRRLCGMRPSDARKTPSRAAAATPRFTAAAETLPEFDSTTS